ncbi:aminoglycoside phosphotransferase family protein [Actinoplanes sichuanensis]|uniref:Aminoglycoside phosphotransferase family protein n=1 Tax=Actinoplanes sichuanensis TaxID=512349 RepID=A0ABW4ASX7_9ACTN|nr:aminoglycoside phosphotransferase family protein [Actinoplanes sichuanensis]BEL05203.1 aminoglycoside phosphotransferase family protein [Actinoplanes sichuanensis]
MTHSTIEITAELVHELVREQHPDLAGRPVRLGARGWANQLWRLGDDLAVRLPWAIGDVDRQIVDEYSWLPTLVPTLPMAVPVPQRLGEPSARFPRPWMITTWVPGTPADREPVTRSDAAGSLAAFLTALHQPAPDRAPEGQDRGGPLADRADGFENGVRLAFERGLIDDPDAVRAVWRDAVSAPAWSGPRLWLHADLHPANVLTDGGSLCGIVDFGDMCAGDPAYDLSAAWLLLPDGSVDDFYAGYRPAADAATRRRARGWAMARVLSGLLIGDNGVHGRPGGKATWAPPARAALRRLLA